MWLKQHHCDRQMRCDMTSLPQSLTHMFTTIQKLGMIFIRLFERLSGAVFLHFPWGWLHESSGSLCRDPSILVERNKNELCDYRTTEPARLAGIPVLWCRGRGWKLIINNHACRAAQRMNEARNRTAENTLLMRIASPVHVIRPLQWVALSRSSLVKALEFADFVVRVWEYDLGPVHTYPFSFEIGSLRIRLPSTRIR